MTTDPRRAGGNIAGPGGPHDRNGVIIDASRAVLLDAQEVALVETADKSVVMAVMLHGRINKTTERANILFLMNGDGAAGLVSEVLGLASRLGNEFHDAFVRRIEQLAADGNLNAASDPDGTAP